MREKGLKNKQTKRMYETIAFPFGETDVVDYVSRLVSQQLA